MFGSLSSAHQIMVLLALRGGPAYAAQMKAAATETSALGRATLKTAANMNVATKNSWLHNQALYTMRRFAFYGTLAVVALGAEIAKLGFTYLNTMQTAKVALKPIFANTQALNKELNKLFVMSTLSPFLFKDTVEAFRVMYFSFRSVGLSAAFTNKTIQAIMNGLSAVGKATPAGLNRVSVQLQHMANIGKPTGQVLLALARDGLPVYTALRTELKLNATSLADIAKTGLTAKQVIQALDKYLLTSKGFSGAALRQANLTLSGSWRQFKDILSQAAGRGEAGIFSGLQNALKGINYALAPLLRSGKPITLTDIANAIDKQLTPSTHLVINAFITFSTWLRTTIILLGILAKTVQILLKPFDLFFGSFGIGQAHAKLLGIALGVLTTIMITQRIAVLLLAGAYDLWKFSIAGIVAASRIYAFALGLGSVAADTLGISMTALNVATIAWLTTLTAGIAALVLLYAESKKFRNTTNNVLSGKGSSAFSSKNFYGGWWDPITWAAYPLKKFALGGTSFGGPAMVGEHGPEIMNLKSGTTVTPFKRGVLDGMGSINIKVYPQDIYFEGKKVAIVTAQAVMDKEARL